MGTERTVTVAEAGRDFDGLVQRVMNEQDAVVVEREGEPQVVLLSVEEYRQLRGDQTHGRQGPGWEELLRETHEQIRRDGGGPLTPPVEEVIREMREERDEQLLNNLR
ncbi:MAG: type II toxin-antitoxin system Phd/YefM family antitoxin [Chloroflexota bacterium]|nr:type II toxin-antitoxin system Phd/YefM family antitoxin [Chloroflexota bacterium]